MTRFPEEDKRRVLSSLAILALTIVGWMVEVASHSEAVMAVLRMR
jgi:hypothetical protein